MPHSWCQVGQIRRDQIESGLDITFNKVFRPYFENIVKNTKPTSVLEIGCGTGHLSKDLIMLADTCHAIEPSFGMHKIATEVLNGSGVELCNCKIEDYVCNSKYDLIISHLCVHTVENLESFLSSTSRFMKSKTRLVFSLPHPCFYNNYKKIFSENEYCYMRPSFKRFDLRISKDDKRPITNIPYFHRPLSYYFDCLSKNRLLVANLDEIYPPDSIQNLYGDKWENPRYLSIHARLFVENQ